MAYDILCPCAAVLLESGILSPLYLMPCHIIALNPSSTPSPPKRARNKASLRADSISPSGRQSLVHSSGGTSTQVVATSPDQCRPSGDVSWRLWRDPRPPPPTDSHNVGPSHPSPPVDQCRRRVITSLALHLWPSPPPQTHVFLNPPEWGSRR